MLLWWVEVEDPADSVPQAVNGALGGLAQVRHELGERLLDRVGVGGVGRKEGQLGASRFDGLAPLVARQVVYDDDVAGREVGHYRRHHAGAAQAGDEGGGLQVSVGYARAPPLASPAATVATRHVGGRSGLVDDGQAFVAEVELAIGSLFPAFSARKTSHDYGRGGRTRAVGGFAVPLGIELGSLLIALRPAVVPPAAPRSARLVPTHDRNLHRLVSFHEAGMDALGLLEKLDVRKTFEDLLPDHPKLEFSKSVADTAVDTVAEGDVLPRRSDARWKAPSLQVP